MNIFHAADVHLGRRRLDERLPDKDFADAFAFVAGKAIEEIADVFLIAGDLFDREQVEPPHTCERAITSSLASSSKSWRKQQM